VLPMLGDEISTSGLICLYVLLAPADVLTLPAYLHERYFVFQVAVAIVACSNNSNRSTVPGYQSQFIGTLTSFNVLPTAPARRIRQQ